MIETSTEVAALFKSLAAFQGTVSAPKKTSSNPHFKSKFADLAEVLETARAPLAANGLALVQIPFGECDGVVRVVTMVTHESGQWLRASLSMPVAQKTPQAVGSAITYARRYCAMAALGMAADDDDGESAEGRGKAAKQDKQEQRSPQDRLDAVARGERDVPKETSIGSNYNKVAQAAKEVSRVALTGEVDSFGLLIPPGEAPRFQSGEDVGKSYGEVPAGKVRALLDKKDFREKAAPLTQVWAAYIVATHELSKLKEQSK